MPKPQILLVDDSELMRGALERALGMEYTVSGVASRAEALKRLSPPPDAVLLDLRLDESDPTNTEGLALLEELRQRHPDVPVIMITAYGDVESAVACMRRGAADFIQKTSDLRELKARIEKALEQAQVATRLREIEQRLDVVEPRQLVGTSDAIRRVKELVAGAAKDGRVTVLLTGESGTGKELVARAIHASGPRARRPFIGAALIDRPASTIEGELFGYEPGAFTDARRRHVGLLERAHGSVLFLDEIGTLPQEIQPKLLRFLEERVITRLGGGVEIPVDVQVVAASNSDLRDLVHQGRFREDLYYRLRVYEIRLPPLRDRPEDIPLLVDHFLARFEAAARGVKGVATDALDAMMRYRWPGNVRELRNAIEAAVIKASLRRHPRIELEDLPEDVRFALVNEPSTADRGGANAAEGSLALALARTELAAIDRALRACGGKKTEAWKMLGLNDRFALRRRVHHLLGNYPELAQEFPALAAAYRRGARPRRPATSE